MGLHACVRMQTDNNDLVNHDRAMGGWGKDGQRQGVERSIESFVLDTRCWVGSFIYTNLLLIYLKN